MLSNVILSTLYLLLVLSTVADTLEGSIKVSLQFREGQAVLSVSDTGVGIPLSEIERIGERFYRMAVSEHEMFY